MMTRGMFYCKWCRTNPTEPCDTHRRGYERMLALAKATRRPWYLRWLP